MRNALLFLGLIFISAPTWAVLGEDESSVELDRQDLVHARHAATHSKMAQGKYSVHQIVSDQTTILEYANSHGVVFAISWSGPNMPVLSGLLGRYGADVERRMKQEQERYPAGNTRPRTSQTSLDAGRITFENSGHMGS